MRTSGKSGGCEEDKQLFVEKCARIKAVLEVERKMKRKRAVKCKKGHREDECV